MKISLKRSYFKALKELLLKDNTNDSSIKECFNKQYNSYINIHKESNYKYIKDQKEFDKIVLSSVLLNKKYSTCDYCHSIESVLIPMGSNGYKKCDKCSRDDNKTKKCL